MSRVLALALSISVFVGGCTVLFPTVGVLRAHGGADIFVDDHGCEVAPDGTTRRPCTHPGPVSYTGTIGENLLVGLLFDTAIFLLVKDTLAHVNDNTGA